MRAVKVVLALLGVVLVVVAGGIAALAIRQPAQRPPSAEKIEATPARLARGEYLSLHVANCIDCHSDHQPTYGLPIKPGSEGQGGVVFDEGVGIPGAVVARNLTSDVATGKGGWTDGELLRAIREGVDRDGSALFPMMPYEWFRELSDEDARAIVAYLRTLPARQHTVAAKRVNFPVNLFIKGVPKPLDGPIEQPDPKDTIRYGRYLAAISGCIECHTEKDARGQRLAGQELGGGFIFKGPWGNVVSVNITPLPGTYLSTASKEEFVGRFKSWNGIDAATPAPKGRNTVMPWRGFAGMTEQDLGAVYDYLKSVKPVDKRPVAFPEG